MCEEGPFYLWHSFNFSILEFLFKMKDGIYYNFVPFIIAKFLIFKPPYSLDQLIYFPIFFKIFCGLVYSLSFSLLLSERFKYISENINTRFLIALLFIFYPHLDFSFGYNATYCAFIILLWVGSTTYRQNTKKILFIVEILLGCIFSISKPVIVYAAVPYILLCLLSAIRQKCKLSIILFITILCTLLFNIYLTDRYPGQFTSLFDLILNFPDKFVDTIIIIANGYIGRDYLLGAGKNYVLLYILPFIVIIISIFIFYKFLTKCPERIFSSQSYYNIKLRSSIFLLTLIAVSLLGNISVPDWPWIKQTHLYQQDPFLIFNRHLYPSFMCTVILIFIIYQYCEKIRIIDSKLLKIMPILWCFIQIFYSAVFSNIYIFPIIPAHNTKSENINVIPEWHISAYDLLDTYPAAVTYFPNWSINLQCEREVNKNCIKRPFKIIKNNSKIVAGPQHKKVREIIAIVDEPLGACSILRLNDANSNKSFIGRRNGEAGRFIFFSISPPLLDDNINLTIEMTCSATEIQGQYIIFNYNKN
jgi:hypothetical protein